MAQRPPRVETDAPRLKLGGPAEAARREDLIDGRLQVASARGVRGPERPLLEALGQEIDGRVLVVGSREGVAALAVAKLHPRAEVHLFGMDAYELDRARASARWNRLGGLRFSLGADLPGRDCFDWVAFPAAQSGDALLTAELLAQAHRALKPRGKLLAATDNRRDRWLHRRILEVFGTASILERSRWGTVYVARKDPAREPRRRDYRRRFGARVLGRELVLETRPGVFSHGKLDQGTLALSESVLLREESRVLDAGSGSGALGIACALAAPRGRALLWDSSARAAHVARENIARNRAGANAAVLLAHDLAAVKEGSFDLALANPPYYGDHRITERFAREARRALAPGGGFFLVTRAPRRPVEIIRSLFGEARVAERRGYAVIQAARES